MRFIAASTATAAVERSGHGRRRRRLGMGHRKNRALVCDGERRLREWGAPVLGLPASAAVQVAVGGVRPQTLSSL
jgi:hypothetical protein